MRKIAPLVTLFLLGLQPTYAADSDEIAALKQQLKHVEESLNATIDFIESNSANKSSQTTIGGYGELHYNQLQDQSSGGGDKNRIDFHRFVLMFNHQFTSNMRLVSELELEHSIAGESQPGEIELEQAYIEFRLNEQQQLLAGIFLVPVGMMNQSHEPTHFYGVERNSVEKEIIPTTWWEGGVLYHQQLSTGLDIDVALHSGLNSSSWSVRSGRQKVADATANTHAVTARLNWQVVPGLALGVAFNHQSDLSQGAISGGIAANLLESHIDYQQGAFALKALYAKWDMDDNGAASGRQEQFGWYVEPAYKLSSRLGVFARQSVWDKQAADSIDSEYQRTTMGINFWPHDDVVLKVDYQVEDNPVAASAYRGVNLGLGYQF